MSLYQEFFTSLKETNTDPFLLGYIGRKSFNDGKIEAKIVDDDDARHPDEWTNSGLTWRYVPKLEMLTFWAKPEPDELMAIKDWLEKKNYVITRVYVMGRAFRIKKPTIDPNIPPSLNKPLGMDENTKNKVYCGVLLNNNSQNKLKERFKDMVPDDWTYKCHHMTIDPFKECADSNDIGKPIDLMVTHFGKSDKACAVKVIGYKGKTNNAFPHVTIAVNELNGGQAKDSNKITEWIPIMEHIVLSGTIENIEYNPLTESPLGSYTTIGFDDKKRKSFNDPRDVSLITHPSTVEKVKNMFKNTDIDFNLYFVNKSGLRRFTERGPVKKEFLTAPYPKGLGLKPEEFTITQDSITIFFVSNVGSEKVPMTAWTMAHRIGHAMQRTYHYREYNKFIENQIEYILKNYYGISKRKTSKINAIVSYEPDRKYELIKGRLFEAIGTMRSAREKKLHLRPNEFYHELFAQNLQQGQITFNPLPNKLIDGYAFGKPHYAQLKDPTEANEVLQTLARDASYYIDGALGAVVGDIFVM